MTPDAREAVTSEVAGLVDCEERLNDVNGEEGFAGNFVEDDPAIVVV